ECAAEVTFLEEALDAETKRVRDEFPCPACKAMLTRRRLERFYESVHDDVTGETVRVPKRVPALINYTVDGKTHEKAPDAADLAVIARTAALPLPDVVPSVAIPYMHMTHERARMDSVGVTHLHHFFMRRAALALAGVWRKA